MPKRWIQTADVEVTDSGALLVAGATEPQGLAVNVSASGDSELATAVTGKKVTVLGILLVAAEAVTVSFKSGTTAITGPMPLAAGGGFARDAAPGGFVFQTSAGEALKINLSAAVGVGGCLTYCLE